VAADLIVYALVAAGLVIWLRNILGTRHGEERERPNPFVIPPDIANTEDMAPGKTASTAEDKIAALIANPDKVMAVDSKTAENGLLDISKADRSFDVNFFLEGAQDAFVMIVEAFAKADRDTLQNLLTEPVYKGFDSAIRDRESRGETVQAEILAVRRAVISAARYDGRMAYVTVRFQADETTVTRDREGVVIAGHPEKSVPMRDMWTFGRDLRSRDPRWLVFETGTDPDGDNDVIPNAG
jgi:predicted lipid-binding transport protein (Tim44 family)